MKILSLMTTAAAAALCASAASAQFAGDGELVLLVDPITNGLSLEGSNVTTSGYNLESDLGLIIPDALNEPAPYQFYLANTSLQVAAGSIGTFLTIDDTIDINAGLTLFDRNDLIFEYGIQGQNQPVAGRIVVIPEPTALVAAGLGGLALLRRRRSV